MNGTLEKDETRKRSIISLDDIKLEFVSKNINGEYVINENVPILSDTVGAVDTESSINEVEETMYKLENSIDSLPPGAPIIKDSKIEKIKETARKKIFKKSIREELNNVSYDDEPELSNLENTVILNASVLKQEIENSKNDKDEEKINKRGKIIVCILFTILILFALSIPFIANYLV